MSDTFLLIHGAWHGAWCWTSVMGELERMGHRAYAIDLPGRWSSPLPHAQVTRQVWVDAVARYIEERDLRDVILAGHSLGGLTITGVGLKVPRQIKRLIYVTALVPPEEGSLADDMAQHMSPTMQAALKQLDGGVSAILEPGHFRDAFIQDASRDLQDFVYAAMVPEAMAPMADPVPMKEFRALGLPVS